MMRRRAERIVPKAKPGNEELYIEFHVIEQQIGRVREYLDRNDEQLQELHTVMHAIEQLKGLKGADAYAPLANGIFFKCRILETDSLRMNVGDDIVVNKPIDECIEMLRAHERTLAESRHQAIEQLDALTRRADELGKKV